MPEKIEIMLVDDSGHRSPDQPTAPGQPASPGVITPQQPSSPATPSSPPPLPGPVSPPENSRPSDSQPTKYEFLNLRAAMLLLADRFLPRNIARWLERKTEGMEIRRNDDTAVNRYLGKLDGYLSRLLGPQPLMSRSQAEGVNSLPTSKNATMPGRPTAATPSGSTATPPPLSPPPLPTAGAAGPPPLPVAAVAAGGTAAAGVKTVSGGAVAGGAASVAATSATAGTGAATAGGAGATAGAASGVAGAAGGSALLGPIGIAIAAIILLLAGLGFAFKKVSDIFSSEADRLSEFGGAIAGAKAQIEVNQMERDMRRAERIGPQLADMELKRDQLADANHELWTAIYELLLEFAPIMKFAMDAMSAGLLELKTVVLFMKALFELATARPGTAIGTALDAVDAQVAAFEKIANMFLDADPKQGGNRWILNQNPFGPAPGPNPNPMGP